ncbi:hypothetical protein L1887_15364 [Cichorium endivia]|nr:hypothetical protein L1887_15364 [Cichorium endivia]
MVINLKKSRGILTTMKMIAVMNSKMRRYTLFILGFVAVLGISYQKILNEKHNLERVLRKGIEKYPNSEALKDWKIKMNREFKLEEMEEETERFENDHVQDEETETEEEIPEHDEGKGKELVVIQEAEHLNHISPEIENINNENEDGYITPIAIRVENLESTQSLSSTQFFEQPGVLEEVEDMLLKATTKSNEDKPKMTEEAEKFEEEQENIEKIPKNLDKGKQKRQPKISKQKCSPYVQRITEVDVGVKKEELNLYQALITTTKDVE